MRPLNKYSTEPSQPQKPFAEEFDNMMSTHMPSRPRRLLNRARRWLYPPRHCEWPETSLPKFYQDGLITRTVVQLCWRDRLRVIVSGRLQTETKIRTENFIGQTATNTQFTALPPKWMEQS